MWAARVVEHLATESTAESKRRMAEAANAMAKVSADALALATAQLELTRPPKAWNGGEQAAVGKAVGAACRAAARAAAGRANAALASVAARTHSDATDLAGARLSSKARELAAKIMPALLRGQGGNGPTPWRRFQPRRTLGAAFFDGSRVRGMLAVAQGGAVWIECRGKLLWRTPVCTAAARNTGRTWPPTSPRAKSGCGCTYTAHRTHKDRQSALARHTSARTRRGADTDGSHRPG
jgi:hypothetical protein